MLGFRVLGFRVSGLGFRFKGFKVRGLWQARFERQRLETLG